MCEYNMRVKFNDKTGVLYKQKKKKKLDSYLTVRAQLLHEELITTSRTFLTVFCRCQGLC